MATLKASLVSCLLSLLCSLVLAQTADFIYGDFDPSFEQQVSLTVITEVSATEQEKNLSPYATRGFWTKPPDFSREAPWSTTVFIDNVLFDNDGTQLLGLTLHNHANTLPRISWLNEELLHLQVWWGRAVGSELILHVPSGEFIYRSMFYWTQVMATTGLEITHLPNFTVTLEHLQGAPPADFHSLSVSRLLSDYDDVRQVSIEIVAPIYTECFLEAQVTELDAVYALLQQFIAERDLNNPPRPPETVCRNCTIYQLSWSIDDREPESFDFSEQRPFRYPALDGLFPIIDGLIERLRTDGECGA